jgi:GntR family transcriptional regulator / MocR family aminotransferase
MIKDPRMTKSIEPRFELPITIPPRGDRLRALHQQLRAAILEGRLRVGLRLPPTRGFARALGISRNTAVATYDLLLSEGYVTTRRGGGTYVADVLPHLAEHKSTSNHTDLGDRRLNRHWRRPVTQAGASWRTTRRFDFRVGVPELRFFPMNVWRRLSARALRTRSRELATYESPAGLALLREAIARHVSFARAVACGAEDIIVTAGAQQAFDLLARILVTADKTVVAVEDPGYPPLRSAFAAAGAKVVYVPVDEEGLVVERLPANAAVICVTPSHQFPLGTVMTARRRAALLKFAHVRGAVVIEDDYDAEFRFEERPLDALQTLDRSDSVFYDGTFSKSLFPGLRLGFVAAPRWAVDALVSAKQLADWHCPVPSQETLAAFISEGHLARHIRRMRRAYSARHQILLDRLQRDLGHWLRPVASAAGLHVAALTTRSVDLEIFLDRARHLDVHVSSLRAFQFGRARFSGLVFGYGAIEERSIVEGIRRLQSIPTM